MFSPDFRSKWAKTMKILPFSPDFGLEWAKTIDFLPFSPDWPIFHKPLEPSLWFVGMVRLVGQVGRSGVSGGVEVGEAVRKPQIVTPESYNLKV